MNVVNSRDSSASEICQKPLLVSNVENTIPSTSCVKVSSTLGNG